MPTRAIFAEFSIPWWITVAQNLVRRHAWQPVYWVAAESMAAQVEAAFPDAVFHANHTAVLSIPAPRLARLPLRPLEPSLLEKFAFAESVAMRMMERMDPDETFSYWDRLRLYHRYLRYWQAVLDHLAPDVVIFPVTPHLIYDYVLFQLCQDRGIRTVQLNETSFEGLVFASQSHEDCSGQVVAAYERLLAQPRPSAASPRVERHIKRLRGEYADAAPGYIKELFTLDRKPPEPLPEIVPPVGLFTRIRGAIRHVVSRIHHAARFKRRTPFWRDCYYRLLSRASDKADVVSPEMAGDAVDAAWEIYRKMHDHLGRLYPVTYPIRCLYLRHYGVAPERADFSGLMYWLFRLMGMRKRETLMDHYARLARPVDLDRPFVYVALHYMPEKSTSPEGSVFAEQFLMIHLLSWCLPPGWQVYVKEHPFQFDRRGSGFQTRRTQFYDDLAELPNVQLVEVKRISFDLIDRAQAVATVTGTSGWESVIRGKPVLIFGHAWYKGCEGVFYVPTVQSCTEALCRIADGYKPDPDRVRLFAQALEQVALPGYTIPELAAGSGISVDENIETLTRLLLEAAPRAKAA
jgi:hypothetical protein